MKTLYGARCLRWDLLHAINTLAREVSRWNRNCDIRMRKLFDYLAGTVEHVQEAFCGDKASDIHLLLYCDASFADCTRTHKSTSGVYLVLAGANTFIPIACICKKQTCVSHPSTESEIIALELGLRSEALPVLTLWDRVVDVMNNNKSKDVDNNNVKKQPYRPAGDPVASGCRKEAQPNSQRSGGNLPPHSGERGEVREGDQEFADRQALTVA